MKKIIFVVIILYAGFLWCAGVLASPFLVSDPVPSAVGAQYEITEGGNRVVLADNQPDGSIRYDLKDVTTGQHNYQIRYVKSDPLWGTVYSTTVPFTFVRPELATGDIKTLRLVP